MSIKQFPPASAGFDGNLTGGQLAFPATQNASADANTLDDYEEGTWTPSVEDSSNNPSESQTYSAQLGWYIKIGRVVIVWGNVTMTSLGTLTTTQNCRIAGLPFTSDSTANFFGGMWFTQASGMAITAGQSVVGIVNNNATRMFTRLWDATTGTTDLLLSELTASGSFAFAGAYMAAN